MKLFTLPVSLLLVFGLSACTQNNTSTPVPTSAVQPTTVVIPSPTSSHTPADGYGGYRWQTGDPDDSIPVV